MDGNLSMKIFLPFHIGSGNRGCEGITRGTASILNMNKKDICVLTDEIDEDRKNGLDQVVSLHECYFESAIMNKVLIFLSSVLKKDVKLMLRFAAFLRQASRRDIVLITGGDLYCYSGLEWQLDWVSCLAKWRGCKLILWGCSINKERLNKNMILRLKKYDGIYARENYTKGALTDIGIKNVKLMSDPAFRLKAEPCALPLGMLEGNVVGVNISCYTNLNSYSLNTVFCRNILTLFRYILEKSDMQILLIPHVFWADQDDRILLNKIYRRYRKTNRVLLLKSEELSYCQIRYVISKCRFFIGSRTHSMISAYAMKIPSLALGYSIKSKGILKDLNLTDNLIVDCNNLKSYNEILKGYLYMAENEKNIKEKLEAVILAYSSYSICKI